MFKKVFTARAKLEAELSNIYCDINISFDKLYGKVKIEHLIVKSKDAFTSVIEKNEEPFDVAHKTEDPDATCKNLEQWLEIVTKKHDEIITAARGYIDSVQQKDSQTV